MSDTPRMDAIPHNVPQLAMHARQLERELNEAKETIHNHMIQNGRLVAESAAWKECAEELACWLNDGKGAVAALEMFNNMKDQSK